MKKTTLLTAILFLLTGFAYAQQTYVPDNHFEHYLETHDANGNTVSIGSSNSMGNGIDNDDYVTTSKINTITDLDIYGKQISDLTGIADFTALQTLDCSDNQLTILDVSQNTDLQNLYCHHNQITSIDVSQNTALQRLSCYHNLLTSLNIQNGNNHNLSFLYAKSNPYLTCIQVDNPISMNNKWANAIDVSETFSVHCPAGETYVPDDNFEHYLETHDANGNTISIGSSNSMGNGIDNDDYITTANINAVTDLNVSSQSIADLTGIEDFTALQSLNCSSNQITSLNISQNSSLQILNCRSNHLTHLDLRNGNNTNFTYFNATSNSNLTCIHVEDVSYMNNHWANAIDITANYVTHCASFDTYVPDNAFELYLETHDANGNLVSVGDPNSMGNGISNDDYVTTSRISSVTRLIFDYRIHDISGIEDFTALEELNCAGNLLSSLDLSQNTALKKLNCSGNGLTMLIISQNSALEELICGGNYLSSLDVSQNTALKHLVCYHNQLTSLNTSQNTDLQYLDCNYNQLTNLDLSSNTVLQYLDCWGNDLTNLDLSRNTVLQYLNCWSNDLTNLDLSSNTVLQYLDCWGNDLTNLVIPHNTTLQEIRCQYNDLTSLDVSQSTALKFLWCTNNQLTSLNMRNGNNRNLTGFSATDNPNLTCIEVDDPTYMDNHLANAIDPTASYSSHCPLVETYVPDDNFEHYLETHDANGNTVPVGDANSMGNGIDNDDNVTTSNINTVTNLDIASQNITDLTGIEAFMDLQTLDCHNNQITNLDAMLNTGLQSLDCSNNQIINLYLSQNSILQSLNCSNNQLINLYLSQNSILQSLDCSDNQLISLDLRNGNNTNFTYFIANNNTNLTCIYVDNPTYMNNNWPNAIDATANYVTHCPSLETYVPDDIFEHYLETHNSNGNRVSVGDPNSMGNGIDNDDYVTTSKINSVTHLNLHFAHNISDLTGIEDFTALQELDCDYSNITNLDVTHNINLQTLSCAATGIVTLDISHNTNLITLDCNDNRLASLDVTQNTALQHLNCNKNFLTELDISQNTALQWLDCGENYITSLNVTHNRDLQRLYCNKNQLSSLDLSQNTELEYLNCGSNQLSCLNVQNGNNHTMLGSNWYNALYNPNLTCIQVDDVSFSNAHWRSDASASYSTHCPCNDTYVPDDHFESYLETHDAGGNVVSVGDPSSMGNGIANDNYVITYRINTVANINITSQNIADLTGIEDFAALQVLNCSNNQLVNLDLSQNTHLQDLNCIGNQLTNLNIQNTNNTNLTNFNATNNPNLTCVEVDDATYMSNHWANAIDATATYSLQCPLGLTYIPDNNFEHFLETHNAFGNDVTVGAQNSMGNGIDNDNYVTTSKINTVTALLFPDYTGIQDFTGIEDFTALQEIYCRQGSEIQKIDLSQNTNLLKLELRAHLRNLDVSHNTALQELIFQIDLPSIDLTQNTSLLKLDCSGSRFLNLDLSQNQALEELICSEIDMPYIDITQNVALLKLDCSNTYFESIDITHNTALQVLNCSESNLLNLDVTHNPALQELYCTNLGLTSLDVTQNPALYILDCTSNSLTSLDLTHNPALWGVSFANNNISDIDVTQNPALDRIITVYNPLTSLDVTQNPALKYIWCYNNQITSLDVTQNPALELLACQYNQIQDLDLSQNPELVVLGCFNNQLTNLNVRNGNNVNLIEFNARNNPNLSCVFVDYANYMSYHFANYIDNTSHYVETQAQCDALAIDSQFLEDVINIYPIPTKEVLNVQSEIDAQYQIYDYAGKKLLQGRIKVGENRIPVQEFAKGLYLIRVDSEGNSLLRKIIIGN